MHAYQPKIELKNRQDDVSINSALHQIYTELIETSKKLMEMGYEESYRKPNLFYYKHKDATFYADLRGSEVVAIYENTRPLIYWRSDNPDLGNSELLEIVLEHFEELGKYCIESRLSFYELFEPGSLIFDNYNTIEKYLENKFGLPKILTGGHLLDFYDQNGKCHTCNKKLNKPGFFCSEECKLKYIRRYIARVLSNSPKFCYLCGSRVLDSSTFEEFKQYMDLRNMKSGGKNYHISSFPEDTVFLCKDCHYEIYHKDKYSRSKSSPGDSEKFNNKKIKKKSINNDKGEKKSGNISSGYLLLSKMLIQLL